MSKISSPTSVSRRASLNSPDVASEAHSSLLKLTWQKLDLAVGKLFNIPENDWAQKESSAKAMYCRSLIQKANNMRSVAKLLGDKKPDGRDALLRLEQRLRSHAVSPFPIMDETLFRASIASRELEHALYVEKGRFSAPRHEIAGFVDIACEVVLPEKLILDGQPAYFPDDEDDFDVDSLEDAVWGCPELIDPLSVDKQVIPVPHWTMKSKRADLWVDVRITYVPIGQLIRETKLLRDHGEEGTIVVIVMETVDESIREMLEHEDFQVVSRAWVEAL